MAARQSISWFRLARGLLVALALTCGASGSLMAQTLTVAHANTFTSLDPSFANNLANNQMAAHIFDSLIRVDGEGQLQPALAESWKATSPTTWEFKLRRDVKFSDGSPFTAADVIATFNRIPTIKNSTGPFTAYLRFVTDKKAPDPYTLVLTTSVPQPRLPQDVSELFITSAKFKNASTEDFNNGTAMLGTGPFKFLSYEHQDTIQLARNDNYWGPKPDWEHVTIRVITSDPTRVASLLANDVQLIEYVPSADLPRIRDTAFLKTVEKPLNRVLVFQLDSAREKSPDVTAKDGSAIANPLRDVRVRHAMSLAIDRNAIRDRVMDGLSIPTKNLVLPKGIGYLPSLTPDPSDPVRAKQLLAEAGYPDGFAIAIHVSNNASDNRDRVTQAVASMLGRIGITASVVPMPSGALFPRAAQHEFSVAALSWGVSTGDVADPLQALLQSQTPDKLTGSFNWGQYKNPALDELLVKASQTVDAPARNKMLQDATKLQADDYALLPIHMVYKTWGLRKDLLFTGQERAEYTLAQDVHKRGAGQ